MTRQENWSYFKTRFPAAHEAYEKFGKALHEESGPLAERECELIKVAVAAASQLDYALRYHIERALGSGCSAEEVEHAIVLTATTAGFPRMMGALMVFRETMADREGASRG